MIHRFKEDDGHYIWLDVDDEARTGLCIGAGSAYTHARAEAIQTLEEALAELKAESSGAQSAALDRAPLQGGKR